jgi:Fe-S cluster assembly scaffold protein SufB
MLEWRLKAYRHWASLEKAQAEPKWANIKYPPIDYQSIVYYSAPQNKASLKSLDELDPEILRTYEKLGIPLQEQKRLAGVAVDAVFDSVSVATTFKKKAGPTQTHPSEQLTREASHRSVMEQGRVQQQLVSIQNGGNLQSSASLSIPVAKRKGPFDIAPLQSGGTP